MRASTAITMRLAYAAAIVHLCTAAPAAGVDRSATPPVRPTYQDVSIKLPSSSFYEWFRGRTATQAQRDAMEETLTGVAVPEALRYARTISACAGQVPSLASQLTKVTAKLGTTYEQNSLLPAGSWWVPIQGRHYSFEQYILHTVRSCSTGSGAASACAKSPLMTPALADLLDIRIENGRCVAGAAFGVPAPLETYSSYRAAVGGVQSKTAMVPPDPTLLHATHAAHRAVSDFRCGVGPEPPAGSVQAAHLALEATATNGRRSTTSSG
jgi:hypothetical protein